MSSTGLLSTTPPPLPILSHMVGTYHFMTESLDDATEDAFKFGTLFLLWWSTRFLCAYFNFADIWCRTIPILATAIFFGPIDRIADQFGDSIQAKQNYVRHIFGLDPKNIAVSNTSIRDAFFRPVHLVDDFAEDSFKLFCIGAHAYSGNLLSTSLGASLRSIATTPHGIVLSVILQIFRVAVRFGTPMTQYSACDEYADLVGDYFQESILSFLNISEAVMEPSD